MSGQIDSWAARLGKWAHRAAPSNARKTLIVALLAITTLGLRPQPAPIIGVHVETTSISLPWLVEPTWVRRWLRWYEVEVEPGVYTWDERQDRSFTEVKETRSNLLLTFITTPDWARIYPEQRCSPPKPEYLDDFAAFINAAIDRYKPQAVELINEPEVPHDQIGDVLDYWIGCWGLHGFYYAEMLKTVYPAIKAAHPDVLVVAGSLLLDDEQRDFWPEVQQTGGSGFYDVLSFHAYTYYPINDFDVAFRKAKYLREIGETVPLWLTEASLLCSEYAHCGAVFQDDQAEFLEYLFLNAPENEIDLLFWFTLAENNWQNSDLVSNHTPKPSWYTYRDIVLRRIMRRD